MKLSIGQIVQEENRKFVTVIEDENTHCFRPYGLTKPILCFPSKNFNSSIDICPCNQCNHITHTPTGNSGGCEKWENFSIFPSPNHMF